METLDDLIEDNWLITGMPFAPEQNPVEDLWLRGKNWLRKRFAYNKTSADVKACFVEHLQNGVFSSAEYDGYTLSPQII